MEESSFDRLSRLERRLDRRRRIFRLPLRRLKDRENPLEEYNSAEFKRRFHMYKETAIFVLSLIEGDLSGPLKRGTHIPPMQKLLIALRFFASGSFQLVVGDLNRVCQPTVSNLIRQVARAIAKHRKSFIKFPTHEEAGFMREKFYQIKQFPGVVGAVDGCLIPIKSPGGLNAELFRCRKDFFALNIQGVCDPELNFTNIVARWYGSAHDSRVFENSFLNFDLESGRSPGLLLGDGGYPCLPHLMTPLEVPVTIAEKRYNRSQMSTRNTIERTFGIWKRRFPCLNDLRIKLPTSLVVIVCTAVLHNISRARHDIFENDDYDVPPKDDPLPPPSGSLLGKAVQQGIIQGHFI